MSEGGSSPACVRLLPPFQNSVAADVHAEAEPEAEADDETQGEAAAAHSAAEVGQVLQL